MLPGYLRAEEAAERLGVKPATLYAYVSRGLVHRRRGPDGRSLFSLAEVDRLAGGGRRERRDRRRGPELRIESAVTAIEDGRVFYRGHDLVTLAVKRTFEEVAELLWTGSFPLGGSGGDPWLPDSVALQAATRAQSALPAQTLPLDRLRVAMAALAAADPLRQNTHEAGVLVTGRRMIAALADSLPRRGPEAGWPQMRSAHPMSGSIAARLWSSLVARLWPPAGALEAMNGALVLVADHELSMSTMAARIAASIGADPCAVVSVGLNALGGATQTVASLAVEDLLAETASPRQAAAAIGERLRRGDRLPGFGHRLYPEGDPRAPVLLELLGECWGRDRRMATVEAVMEATRERGLPSPNIDFMLGALVHLAGMQRGASEAIFGVARAAGLLAHALEEYQRSSSIRPRAVYVGVPVRS